ncbi:hypothetical protein O1D97_03090 [Marinomonas sp. 15G1-11]|uniref:Hemolysin type calcium-binding protein n=1 Tax=Marinomonas phaeophyticola TaxID=3004091 RepID=A0ABT4JQM0_9GAMM|nr:hypothetical protein [Marinomonas sp. 15G1-11]MCZ2720654.1 hypothetical protein [Marinomonas sp. 15G1-11]
MAITDQQENQIFKTIIGLFNGGIDANNLSAFASFIDSGNSLLDLSNFLASTSIFKETIMGGKVTVKSQVDVMMHNFGLTSSTDPSSAGFEAEAFFTAQINAGVGFGAIVFEAINYLSQENLPTPFVPYATLLNNKAQVSKIFVGTNPPADVAVLIGLMNDVTSSNTVTPEDAAAYVDAYSANKVLLTSAADNLTGTASSDVYSAVNDPTGNATTLSNADVIDGAGGTDQLDLRIASVMNSGNGGDTISPLLSNIENFYLKNQTTDSFKFNFENVIGEAHIWDKGSISGAHTKVINIDPMTKVGMLGTQGLFFAHFSGDRSGTTDAFTLDLNGAGTKEHFSVFSTIHADELDDDSFEIAHIISSTNASYITIGLNKMTLSTLDISGDATLVMDDHNDFTGLSTIYASSMTAGGIDIDARDSEESNFIFIGSSVDDRIVLKNSTVNLSASLNGGDGQDTLATFSFNNLDADALNRVIGIELLEGANGAESLSASDFTSINDFLFTGTTSTNNGFTLSNLETNDRSIFSTDIVSGGSYALRLEGKNAGNTATIEMRSSDATNGETILTATSNNNERYGIEIRSNISSLTLDSTGTGSNAHVIETSQSNSYFGSAIGNSSTSVFNITGSHDLSLMAKVGTNLSNGNKLNGFSDAANVDASTFTGVLRIAGSSSDDVIKGGSNDDIIYGQGGSDSLIGNGGADQFRLSGYNNQTDVITDFNQGTDKVGLNEFDFTNTNATANGVALSLTDYIENRLAITNIGSSDADKVIELQSSLNNGQISTDTGADIEAFVLVHNTTSGNAELWYDNDWSTSSNRDHVITFDNITDLVGVQSFTHSDFVEYTY